MESTFSGFHFCPLCAILPVELFQTYTRKRLPADRPREVFLYSRVQYPKFDVCKRRTACFLLSASVPCFDALRVSLWLSCGLPCFYSPIDSSLIFRANLHSISRSRRGSPRAVQTRCNMSASIRASDIMIGFSVYSVHSFPFSVIVIVSICFSPFVVGVRFTIKCRVRVHRHISVGKWLSFSNAR